MLTTIEIHYEFLFQTPPVSKLPVNNPLSLSDFSLGCIVTYCVKVFNNIFELADDADVIIIVGICTMNIRTGPSGSLYRK